MRTTGSSLWGSEAAKGSGELASPQRRATSSGFCQTGEITSACLVEEGGALRDLLVAQRIRVLWGLYLPVFLLVLLFGLRGERAQ
jgi:hypothetical protein